MRLFVLILNRVEKLDDLMTAYAREKICGATIIDSTGMARELYGSHHAEEEISFFGSIRKYLNDDSRKTSKTILTVLREDQLETIIRLTEEVVGDFSEPDVGIMVSLPLDFARGKGLDRH